MLLSRTHTYHLYGHQLIHNAGWNAVTLKFVFSCCSAFCVREMQQELGRAYPWERNSWFLKGSMKFQTLRHWAKLFWICHFVHTFRKKSFHRGHSSDIEGHIGILRLGQTREEWFTIIPRRVCVINLCVVYICACQTCCDSNSFSWLLHGTRITSCWSRCDVLWFLRFCPLLLLVLRCTEQISNVRPCLMCSDCQSYGSANSQNYLLNKLLKFSTALYSQA